MIHKLAADAVLLLHLAFILFAVFGGLLTLRWRWIPWLHVPALLWAGFVEASGRICPLTPLENALRRASGEAPYAGGFLDHYLVPLVYPPGLTRSHQLVLAVLLVALNVAIYAWVHRQSRHTPESD